MQINDLTRDGPVESLPIEKTHLQQRLTEQLILALFGQLLLTVQRLLELFGCEQALFDQRFTDPGNHGARRGGNWRDLRKAIQIGALGQQGDQRQVNTAVRAVPRIAWQTPGALRTSQRSAEPAGG